LARSLGIGRTNERGVDIQSVLVVIYSKLQIALLLEYLTSQIISFSLSAGSGWSLSGGSVIFLFVDKHVIYFVHSFFEAAFANKLRAFHPPALNTLGRGPSISGYSVPPAGCPPGRDTRRASTGHCDVVDSWLGADSLIYNTVFLVVSSGAHVRSC
jgi:hypothetical protein